MKNFLVPGKSAVALTSQQWRWITTGNPNGEFQYCFWDFYFVKKLMLTTSIDNQPIAILSVFVTEKGDTLTGREYLLSKTVKNLLRMYQYKLYGKSIPQNLGFSLWFMKSALKELKLESEEELLEKYPRLRQNQFVILVNDFESGIELEVPDRLIEPEIVL